MKSERKKWPEYEHSLSELQLGVAHYIQSLSKFSEAIQIREKNGLMETGQAVSSNENIHRTIMNLTEIQQLVTKKRRYFLNQFPVMKSNYDSLQKWESWDSLDPLQYELNVEEEFSNYSLFHRRKVPLSYESVKKKEGQPEKPWLAPEINKNF